MRVIPEHLKNAPQVTRTGDFTEVEYCLMLVVCGVQDINKPKSVDEIISMFRVPLLPTPHDYRAVLDALVEQRRLRKKGDCYLRPDYVVVRKIVAEDKRTVAIVELAQDGFYSFMLPVSHQGTEWFDLTEAIIDDERHARLARGGDLTDSPYSTLTALPPLMLELALKHPSLARLKISDLPPLDFDNPRSKN